MAAAFYYTNPTTLAKISIFDCLGTTALGGPKTLSTGLKLNGTEQTTFASPYCSSGANLPYAYAGALSYKYGNPTGTDIGLKFGPKRTRYTTSGSASTHILNANTTRFAIFAIGPGSGGGSGGYGTSFPGAAGNSGTGGNFIVAAYPAVAGQNAITIFLAFPGTGGTFKATFGSGNAGNNPAATSYIRYNSTDYITIGHGSGGRGGTTSTTGGIPITNSANSTIYPSRTSTVAHVIPISGSLTAESGTFAYNNASAYGPGQKNGYEVLQSTHPFYFIPGALSYGQGGRGGNGSRNVGSENGQPGTGGVVEIWEYFN